MQKTHYYVILVIVLLGTANMGRKWLQTTQHNKAMTRAIAQNSVNNQNEMGIPNSCKDKKHCITVFIAPWCGVCVASEPTFKALNAYVQKNHPDVGFGLVVGDGSEDQNLKKKMELSPLDVVVDNKGTFLQARGIRAFPTWIVHEKTGQETFKEAGGFHGESDEELKQLMAVFIPAP